MTSYVLVHGSFTDGWYWQETAAILERDGHRVQVAELPSTGTDPATLGDLADDVAEVRRLVAGAGEPVVLVGHSSGGVVITELADHPGVAHSVYVAAFWPARGESALDLFGDRPLPDWMVPRQDGTIQITDDVTVAHAALCPELPTHRLTEWAGHHRLSPIGLAATPSTAPARAHPTTYVVLERDRVVPPELQEALAAKADRVERLATSHQPMLADPAGLAAILDRVETAAPGLPTVSSHVRS